MNANIDISGYGSLEVTSDARNVLEGSTINFSSDRAQFRFVAKSVDRVIHEDLDKFSISGELPIYGNKPGNKEPGDNVLIRSDGATGTTLTVLK